MNAEQFNELINVITQLNKSNLSWVSDILMPIIPAFIGAYVAYKVAKYQVDNSEKQQQIQREEELQTQKEFIIDELKIEKAQEYIHNRVEHSINVVNMLNFTREIIKNSQQIKIRNNNHIQSLQNQELDRLVLENSKQIEAHLITLEMLIELFNIQEEYLQKYEIFYRKTHDYHNLFIDTKKFDEFKAGEVGNECIKLAHDFDTVVRKELKELLNTMKTTNS